jgi:GntR family transcriptional repressor for pyruvate dehydrogenase complex
MTVAPETRLGDGVILALQRETLSERVARTLKRLILAEHFQPGDRLPPERRLAEQLNVSRTVLREAQSVLSGEGIIYRASPRVLCIADFDRVKVASEAGPLDGKDADTRDLVELRVIIELGAVDAIVRRVTDAHLKEIERWVLDGERRVAAGEPVHFADAHFHTALLRVLGNRALDSFLPVIEEHLRQSLFSTPHPLTQITKSEALRATGQHREIFEAIKRRDAAETRRTMYAHLLPYLDGEA